MVWALSLSTTYLIIRSLTAWIPVYGIRSLIEFGKLRSPLAHSVLYLRYLLPDASPKAISRRTSYLRVRLEFHRYPQVIPALFNVRGFGPPRDFTPASTCSWVGHPVSGLWHTTKFALFRLAFAAASHLKWLTSLHTITRWPVLQKVRGRPLNDFHCL